MTEAAGTPVPSSPKKFSPWMIVAVVVVLCCSCVGAVGLLLAFGGDILNELGVSVFVPTLAALM